MDRNADYKRLLATCYELEGLLTLALDRKETTPEAVDDMIRAKIRSISEFAGEKSCEEAAAQQSEAWADAVEFEEKEDAEVQPEINVRPDSRHTVTIPSSEPVFNFTLNDKFRFRRELFGGSDADFADALNVAEAMNSREEVEDYFYNDLCWEPSNPDVADFMAIITARFNR
ncbi:MAG: hypothetical protein NC043_03445 [Muribaculaceae bacterium]|nr:hypothetical protein [Muribaculaceae bacterium]